MKQARIRYLLIFFAALFLANNAMAAARACMVQLPAHQNSAIQVVDSGGDAPLCPEADTTSHYLVNCAQSYNSDVQSFSFDTSAVAIAPPPPPHRIWFPAEPGLLVLALAQPVFARPLTILFGNLRN